MDQESLAQIKQIITHATEAAETRLREEIQGVKQHVEIQLREEIQGVKQHVEIRLREEIQGVKQHVEIRLREEIQDVKRHTGVLIEQVEHKIDLLSEGNQSLQQHIDDVRSEIHQESRETRALLRASYQELRQRVEP